MTGKHKIGLTWEELDIIERSLEAEKISLPITAPKEYRLAVSKLWKRFWQLRERFHPEK